MSDVPFGVFLSGGVDSSANVALMSEQMSRPVETFTVGFSDAEYLNELESARRIADRFQTNHHEVIISEKEMQEFLPAPRLSSGRADRRSRLRAALLRLKTRARFGNDCGPGGRRRRRNFQWL